MTDLGQGCVVKPPQVVAVMHVGRELAEKHGGEGWLILDKALVERAWDEIAPGKTLAFQRDLARLNMMFGRRKARTP